MERPKTCFRSTPTPLRFTLAPKYDQMKTIILFISFWISTLLYSQVREVQLEFHKNIELFGYLVHLAEPEQNDPGHPVSIELNKYPEDHKNPLLMQIFERSSKMTYAFFVDLLYNLPELPLDQDYNLQSFLTEKYPEKDMQELEKITVLVDLLNEFVLTSGFENLWINLAPHRSKTLELLTQNKPTDALLSKMEFIYQQQFPSYTIVPSLTVWSTAGWGLRNTKDLGAVYILGPLEKNYDFTHPDQFINLAIHEFGHSFVNAHVLKHTAVIAETQLLFDPLKTSMTQQGYPGWDDCLVEHFVRAGEVFIPETLDMAVDTKDLLEDYTRNRNFIYLPFIVKKLKHYRLEQGLPYAKAVELTLIDLKHEFLREGKE